LRNFCLQTILESYPEDIIVISLFLNQRRKKIAYFLPVCDAKELKKFKFESSFSIKCLKRVTAAAPPAEAPYCRRLQQVVGGGGAKATPAASEDVPGSRDSSPLGFGSLCRHLDVFARDELEHLVE